MSERNVVLAEIERTLAVLERLGPPKNDAEHRRISRELLPLLAALIDEAERLNPELAPLAEDARQALPRLRRVLS